MNNGGNIISKYPRKALSVDSVASKTGQSVDAVPLKADKSHNSGEIMLKIMRKMRISGEALARYSGVSGRTVHRWRHGDCPVFVLNYLQELERAHDMIENIRKS